MSRVRPDRRGLRRPATAVVALGLTLTLATGGVAHARSPGRDGRPVSGVITVSAAASLAPPFDAMGVAFHRAHPRATVTFNYGSSGALAGQVLAGAPVDVYASADPANMDRLVAARAVTVTPRVLARNSMTIVVERGNPRRVTGLADLPRLPIVALCGKTVPCGIYADEVLTRAGVTLREDHVTRGADATATLAAVSPGDADAAIVYVTDARAARRTVTAVAIPDDQNVVAVYPIAPLATSAHPEVAAAFVRFARSAAGQKILARHGFVVP